MSYPKARRASPASGAVGVAVGPRAAGRASTTYGSPRRRPTGNRRRRDPLWARLMVAVGAVLMVTSGGVIAGGKAVIARFTSGVQQAALLGGAGAVAGGDSAALQGALNLLLLGIDQRPADDDLIRADSIMMLHIPASHDQAYLVSIPRDAEVDIPPYRRTGFSGGREKINGAFAHGYENGGGRAGGFELLALTVKQLTGVSFHAGAIVDFGGFEAVVKALGGVDMCVDTKHPVVSEHVGFDRRGEYLHPRDGGRPMVYHPGECRRFAAWEALDYVRQRKSLDDGDYGRQRHQQQFVKALAREAKKQGIATNPVKLYEIINAAGKALTVDTRGVSFENWLFTLRDVADNDVVMFKTNAGRFTSVPCAAGSCEGLTPETRELFEAFRRDTVAEFALAHPDFINTA